MVGAVERKQLRLTGMAVVVVVVRVVQTGIDQR